MLAALIRTLEKLSRIEVEGYIEEGSLYGLIAVNTPWFTFEVELARPVATNEKAALDPITRNVRMP